MLLILFITAVTWKSIFDKSIALTDENEFFLIW